MSPHPVVQKKHVSGVKKHFQASEHVTAAVVESIDNIIELAAERGRRAPPSPPGLAPEAYDFRVVARDAQGKLKLVTGAGAFDDFEQTTRLRSPSWTAGKLTTRRWMSARWWTESSAR